jgi:hypothetical protein
VYECPLAKATLEDKLGRLVQYNMIASTSARVTVDGVPPICIKGIMHKTISSFTRPRKAISSRQLK